MAKRRGLDRRDFLAYLTGGASGVALGTAASAGASEASETSDAANTYGVIDVRAHGALGDGETDDTHAIQRAADATSMGGILLFPPGLYVITDTITMPASITVSGTGLGDLASTGIMALEVMGSLFKWEDDTATGVSVRDLTIAGPRGLGGNDIANGDLGSCGLDFGHRGAQLSLSHLYLDGFTNAIVFREQQTVRIDGVTSNNSGSHGLAMLSCYMFTITGGLFGNVSDAADHAAGVYIADLEGTSESSQIRCIGVTVDESIGSAPSLYIRSGHDVSFESGLVYAYEGQVGVLIGDGGDGQPRDVTIANTVVLPYGTHAASNTVKIMPGSVNTTLSNVKTRTPHGGGDIEDGGSSTVSINVNQSGTIA